MVCSTVLLFLAERVTAPPLEGEAGEGKIMRGSVRSCVEWKIIIRNLKFILKKNKGKP